MDHLQGLDFGGMIKMDLIKIGWEGGACFEFFWLENMEKWCAVVTN
jgi:hypothetical protein